VHPRSLGKHNRTLTGERGTRNRAREAATRARASAKRARGQGTTASGTLKRARPPFANVRDFVKRAREAFKLACESIIRTRLSSHVDLRARWSSSTPEPRIEIHPRLAQKLAIGDARMQFRARISGSAAAAG
jgi:hypothetical protein